MVRAQKYEGGPKKPWNNLLEGGPLVVQASPTQWLFKELISISVPAGIVVRGCVRLQGICWKTLSTRLPISGWMVYEQVHLPTLRWVFSGFWPKMSWPLDPPSLFTQFHLKWHFFVCLFPQMKKVLKGKCFANVEEVKQKMAEALLKGIKIDTLQNCSEKWKK